LHLVGGRFLVSFAIFWQIFVQDLDK